MLAVLCLGKCSIDTLGAYFELARMTMTLSPHYELRFIRPAPEVMSMLEEFLHANDNLEASCLSARLVKEEVVTALERFQKESFPLSKLEEFVLGGNVNLIWIIGESTSAMQFGQDTNLTPTAIIELASRSPSTLWLLDSCTGCLELPDDMPFITPARMTFQFGLRVGTRPNPRVGCLLTHFVMKCRDVDAAQVELDAVQWRGQEVQQKFKEPLRVRGNARDLVKQYLGSTDGTRFAFKGDEARALHEKLGSALRAVLDALNIPIADADDKRAVRAAIDSAAAVVEEDAETMIEFANSVVAAGQADAALKLLRKLYS